MSTLLLLHGFNNYYNRIRKDYPSVGYKAAVGTGNWKEYKNINFFPNDGVNTTQTINIGIDSTTLDDATEWDADYLVVFDDASTDDNPIVKSRWFVIEEKHNRKKQLILNLRRDLLIDYKTEIDNSTAYIEKGALNFSSTTPDPAFYMNEDMFFNECPVNKIYLTESGQNTNDKYIIFYVSADQNEYIVPIADPNDPDHPVPYLTFPKSRTTSGHAPYAIYYMRAETKAYYAASIISRALSGAGALYDIQLFPYHPINEGAAYNITASAAAVALGAPDVTLIKGEVANYSFERTFTRTDLGLTDINSAVNAKLANQCEKIRIYSPNAAGAFEYNPFKMNSYKADGYVFSVKTTFKPISPYIHIKPEYMRGLYNNPDTNLPTQFTNETRGLVVSGDFSLPLLTDQWATYEINNKNYLNSFNRQVESMEFNNLIDYHKDRFTALSGAGAQAMSLSGGLLAGLLSGLGGQADVLLNKAQRAEALDYTIDQFNYSMQNIRAMPVLLGRVSSFVVNSDVFPYIQTYTCSTTEKNVFKDKLKYNGMKIERIGQIGTYRNYLTSSITYFKCKLIRCPIKEDQHIVSEIASELDKGFYKEV